MSLTHQEWLDMWEDIKKIERDVPKSWNNTRRSIKNIKDKIEQVIGQQRTSADEL